jgi:hypothetical protein
VSPPAGKGKGEEAKPNPPIFQRFSRRRVGSFAGDGGCHHRHGREREKKLSQTHPFSGISRGGA